MVIGGCNSAVGGLLPTPACGIKDAAGPDAELDAGTVCVKGVGTTTLGSVSAGGNDKEELASAEEDGCATGANKL